MKTRFVCLALLGLLGLAALAAPSAVAQDAPAPAGGGSNVDNAMPGGPPPGGFSPGRIWREMKRQYVAGGSTMHFILGLSLLGAAFVLERLFRLGRRNIAPLGLASRADAMWKAGDFEGVEQLAQRYQHSTLGKVLLFVARHRNQGLEQINAVAGDIASRDLARHMMYLFPLALVAVLAPLLGLFGTVVGMIESFEMVAAAGTMGDPSMLSGSISKALITTAYGLIVAMPILFAYHMLKLRTVYLANTLDEEASTLIHDWFLQRADAPGAAGTRASYTGVAR